MKIFSNKTESRMPFAFIRSIPVLIFLVISVFASDEGALILERANRNENIYSNGEFISHLRGNVVFRYDDMKIRADQATWHKSQGVVSFRKGVRVERDRQLLTCDWLHFTRKNNLIRARGDFFFEDSAEYTTLTGREAEYEVDDRNFLLRGNPRLVRRDTTENDTLFISGSLMEYADSNKQATVTENVNIRKGKLVATCRKADYFTDSNSANLRVKPEVFYENHKVVGDSVDLYFGKEALEMARVVGNSHGRYTEFSKHSRDTSITHIWSDSLHLTVSDSGMLDSLYAYGKVLSKYFLKGDSSRANEASGKIMVISFEQDGKVEKAVINGNARSVYHIDESDGRGRNEASGDQIVVLFELGKARVLKLRGSTRGMYFPLPD
ncbi:MAG: hypothetical protein ACLFVE_06780 [Chitinispirillaceae bacterium]